MRRINVKTKQMTQATKEKNVNAFNEVFNLSYGHLKERLILSKANKAIDTEISERCKLFNESFDFFNVNGDIKIMERMQHNLDVICKKTARTVTGDEHTRFRVQRELKAYVNERIESIASRCIM